MKKLIISTLLILSVTFLPLTLKKDRNFVHCSRLILDKANYSDLYSFKLCDGPKNIPIIYGYIKSDLSINERNILIKITTGELESTLPIGYRYELIKIMSTRNM